MSSKNSQLSALIETALVAAFAMALSYICLLYTSDAADE